MGTWRHKQKSKSDNTPDPTESAFFSNEAVGNISTALIREGAQNALDELKDNAKADGFPVRLKLTHSGNKYAVSPSDVTDILGDLIPHLKADGNGIIPSDLPDFTKPMQYLLFEDFNTNGLEGQPDEYLLADVKDPAKPHNFYYFWRAYGRSGKLANKMGSWGVGKSVFPAVSTINCFWALTIRNSDKNAYLIGQSVLKTHDRPDAPAPCGYFPWGFYGVFDNEEFAMPEESPNELTKFQKLFHLKRNISENGGQREQNTGVSIIIPYPKIEINLETLALSTIRQFFYPILKGKLEVELQFEDNRITLTRHTLKAETRKLNFDNVSGIEIVNKDQLLSLFDFVEWVMAQEDNEHIKLEFTKPDSAYRWSKYLFDKVNISDLQQRFDRGEPLAFSIQVKHKIEGGIAELPTFHAYLKKDPELQDAESTFIRDSLTITGVKSLKRKGVRGLVIISDKKLVTFFGQAEGPAHTGWHKDNFRVRYENTEEIISFVQRSLQELYNKLQMPAEGVDKSLLTDLFFIELPQAEEGKRSGKREGAKVEKELDFELPVKTLKSYVLTQLDGGFKISDNPLTEEIPETITVSVAYDRPDNNPFKKYSPLDFRIDKMQTSQDGISVEKIERNIIEFIPTKKTFELKVTGFDLNRDLIVNVK